MQLHIDGDDVAARVLKWQRRRLGVLKLRCFVTTAVNNRKTTLEQLWPKMVQIF